MIDPFEKFCTIAKIRRPHGIAGAMLVEFYLEDMNSLSQYKPIFIKKFDEKIEINIKEIFGKCKNSYRIIADEIKSKEDAAQFRNCEIITEYKNMPEGIYLEQLVGFKVEKNKKIIGTIFAIHNFGAGYVAETEHEDMILIEDLAIEDLNMNNNPNRVIRFKK